MRFQLPPFVENMKLNIKVGFATLKFNLIDFLKLCSILLRINECFKLDNNMAFLQNKY